MKPVVLVVEDQVDIRKLVRMTLAIGNFEVYEADSGECGVRMTHSLRPDVVLMDVMMPGEIDGYQACRQIKDTPQLKDTAVVMLTARGQQNDLADGRTAGADAYLVKPFSPLQLIDTVKDLLARRQQALVA
jgi:two-component system, OmpR family, phosphate regulon response regulator PhoB